MLSLAYDPTLTSIHDYCIALTIQTFVGKVMSRLFNILSSFVIPFLPRIKHLLNFMAAVTAHSDLGAQENKVCHGFQFFPIYLP